MTAVIDLNEILLRRKLSQAEGQMAALAYLREEVDRSGYGLAAHLLDLAIAAIDEEVRDIGPTTTA